MMQNIVLAMCIVNEYARIVGRNNDDIKTIQRKAFVVVFAENHLLTVAQNDRVVCACLAVSNPVVGAVIENNAVNEALNNRCAFVLLRLHHTIDGGRHIHVQRASKECATCAEDEFAGYKRTLDRSERRGFTDKSLRRSRRVLTFGQTIDAVIEDADIEVHVTTYFMNKVVTSDSHAVAVSGHLPNGEFGMGSLHTGSDSATTPMNSIESVRAEVVRHTRRTTDTGDNSNLVGRNTYLRHCFGECR